ncbi:hypothetical protein PHYSODRAFT_306711 [Phytophthora sojae]|uniref:Uncharacterized protein n=1 Tax=Phytophthora sojae (strain P6497) TaxID=1094619 RepID=G5AAH4_PHYSP|nr:hypothetical protein PHYSODRAFT_306711 [Phytophthora sojae]EGZ07603.1 hypothetical protein PHYSODRAFT_306711 [Phytophthora sojae]|eukprot:XP_009537169.1 hypothetical protein PHYSODRAFT_306711 [Phytophthora sojae]
MRRLLRLNPLFLELLRVCTIRSLLTKPYATSTRAAPHIVREYRKLSSQHLLSVVAINESVLAAQPLASRYSISFFTAASTVQVNPVDSSATTDRDVFCVYQRLPIEDTPPAKESTDAETEEKNRH